MTSALSAYALTLEQTSEIVCAYASSPRSLPAYSNIRWIALGAFRVPRGVTARLEVIGHRSGSDVALQLGVFGPQLVTDSLVSVTATNDTVYRSAPVAFESGTVYLIAARATGNNAAAFGVIQTVSLGDI